MPRPDLSPHALVDELTWRGLLFQATDGARDALAAGSLSAYCGFDPTASSLHVGSLVPVMGLVHLQRYGHRPLALVGGGTGMIGDPSGRTAERPLYERDAVERNVRAMHQQLERFLDFTGATAARMRNNADWLEPLGAIAFMRDIGKHFSVNVMMAKESVRSRLEDGISYTEFSYMLLQAYDFLELNRREGVTLQIGGSDQWGNITAGIDLVRRVAGKEAHGFTMPLVTTAAGTKFGKSEAGAVWLDPAQTTPYKFYQFWINTDDRDVGRYLRLFTLLPREEIEALETKRTAHPERREAQRALARDVTARVHGDGAVKAAAEVSALLFGGADPSALSPAALDALRLEVPFFDVTSGIPAGTGTNEQGVDVCDLLVGTGLAASKGAARRLLEQGGVYVNGRRLTSADRYVKDEHSLHDRRVLLRKGARDYALVRL